MGINIRARVLVKGTSHNQYKLPAHRHLSVFAKFSRRIELSSCAASSCRTTTVGKIRQTSCRSVIALDADLHVAYHIHC